MDNRNYIAIIYMKSISEIRGSERIIFCFRNKDYLSKSGADQTTEVLLFLLPRCPPIPRQFQLKKVMVHVAPCGLAPTALEK
jgi:hypothetical protein